MVCKIHLALSEIITLHEENAKELERIQQYLEELSSLLNNIDSSFNFGLLDLRKFRNKLRRKRLLEECGPLEKEFIEELMKYVRTKGEMLMNFKRIEGAPTTNNFHELKFKQLKHSLRRVIGFASAKRYLLSHGERIVFIRMDESLQSITKILQNTDYLQARMTIADERTSRDGLPFIVHNLSKWNDQMQEIDQILHDLGVPLVVKS